MLKLIRSWFKRHTYFNRQPFLKIEIMYGETNKEFFTRLREIELHEMTPIQLASYKHWLDQQDLITQNNNNGNNRIEQRGKERTDPRR